MSDLIERLRREYDPMNMRRFGLVNPDGPEAAEEIIRLTADNKRLRRMVVEGCDALGIGLAANDEPIEAMLERLIAVAVSRSASMDGINKRALLWREEAKLAQAEGLARLTAIRDWDLLDEHNNPNVPEDFKGSPFDYLRKLANDGIKALSSPPYSTSDSSARQALGTP